MDLRGKKFIIFDGRESLVRRVRVRSESVKTFGNAYKFTLVPNLSLGTLLIAKLCFPTPFFIRCGPK
jgi:hypothetical protein